MNSEKDRPNSQKRKDSAKNNTLSSKDTRYIELGASTANGSMHQTILPIGYE